MTREELLDLIQERVPQLRDEAERVLDVVLSAGEKRWECRVREGFGRSDEQNCRRGQALGMGHENCGEWLVLPASLGETP